MCKRVINLLGADVSLESSSADAIEYVATAARIREELVLALKSARRALKQSDLSTGDVTRALLQAGVVV